MPTIAMTPTCAECDLQWLSSSEERRQAHLGSKAIDEPGELVLNRPVCAEREFGARPDPR